MPEGRSYQRWLIGKRTLYVSNIIVLPSTTIYKPQNASQILRTIANPGNNLGWREIYTR